MEKEKVQSIFRTVMLGLAGLVLVGYFFFKEKPADKKEAAQAAAAPLQANLGSAPGLPNNIEPAALSAADGSIAARIGAYGAVELSLNGSWNRLKSPINVASPSIAARPFDFALGTYTSLLTNGSRPAYTLTNLSPSLIRMSADVFAGGSKLRLVREIGFNGGGMARETLFLSNIGAETAVLDEGGVAFTFASFYDFAGISSNNNNILVDRWSDGKKVLKPKFQGVSFTGTRGGAAILNAPEWMSQSDNFFLTIIRPGFTNSAGVYSAFDSARRKTGLAVQVLATNIPAGGTLQLGIDHYVGPMQERMVAGIDKKYTKLFSWWPVFNLFMKPIETGTYWAIQQMFLIINNAGVILILIALLVKLVLLPLSIKAAISMKKMRLLQPKINKLQEKYGNDQQLLQQKTMELYKSEKANPLGGCLPLLLQMPIFFILFRILSRSVELRGAGFLWIKDLTMPDSLFMIGSFSFNLLPLIMSALQLLTTFLQQGKMASGAVETEMQRQMKLQGYLMPLLFLFLFWNMPSGLVLYWTAQNVFSIIEQEAINLSHADEKKKAY